jgi:hypothetical protein
MFSSSSAITVSFWVSSSCSAPNISYFLPFSSESCWHFVVCSASSVFNASLYC